MLTERLEQLGQGYDARQLPRKRLHELMGQDRTAAFEESHQRKDAIMRKYGLLLEDAKRIRDETHLARIGSRRKRLQGKQAGTGALS